MDAIGPRIAYNANSILGLDSATIAPARIRLEERLLQVVQDKIGHQLSQMKRCVLAFAD